MGVHRVVLKSDKIPLDFYYLEIYSWTFVMVLLALDPSNDYEPNEHICGNCPWVFT
jgi:hypothetical protein